MGWLIAFLILNNALADGDHTDDVYRCDYQIVDTGERTKDGHWIFKLVHTDCFWESLDAHEDFTRDRDYNEEIGE